MNGKVVLKRFSMLVEQTQRIIANIDFMKISEYLSDDFFKLPKKQGPKEDFKLFMNRTYKEFLFK